MQLISMKPSLSIAQSIHRQAGDFRLLQKERTASGAIQNAIHGYEGLPRRQPFWRKHSVRGKTVVQSKSYKQGREKPPGKAAAARIGRPTSAFVIPPDYAYPLPPPDDRAHRPSSRWPMPAGNTVARPPNRAG